MFLGLTWALYVAYLPPLSPFFLSFSLHSCLFIIIPSPLVCVYACEKGESARYFYPDSFNFPRSVNALRPFTQLRASQCLSSSCYSRHSCSFVLKLLLTIAHTGLLAIHQHCTTGKTGISFPFPSHFPLLIPILDYD